LERYCPKTRGRVMGAAMHGNLGSHGIIADLSTVPIALPSVQEASSDHEQDSRRVLTQLQ